MTATSSPSSSATPSSSARPSSDGSSDGSSEPSPGADPEPSRWVRPADLDVRVAAGAVRHLAGRIGPRHATSAAHREAAAWVAGQLRGHGYQVRRERFRVPGGDSWGVPVGPGRSVNVVAEPAGFDPRQPYVVVGAHLDSVPRAPGAEDNASGVGVLLAVAEAVRQRRTRWPVVLVGFGAEEPRGPSDDDHHYGSRHHVSTLTPARRRGLVAMVSLDRVGVGARVPVCSAGNPDRLRASLLRAGRRSGVATTACAGNRSSDHWSFVRDGLPGVRLGSTPYAEYHSAADRPGVVAVPQLRRTGRLVLAWLGRPPSAGHRGANGPVLLAHRSPRISRPSAPLATRGAKAASIR